MKDYNTNGNISEFDKEMMEKFGIDKNINNRDDLLKAIEEKKQEMLKEENNDFQTETLNFETKESSISLIPDSLKDYIYFENDYVFSKQKLPRELESDFNKFMVDFYSKDNANVKQIINKIKDLSNNIETTIAELINYNAEVKFIDPLTQGIISNIVKRECENNGIKLEKTENSFGGLAYYTKFKIIDERLENMEQRKSEQLLKKVQDFAREHNYETAEYLCDWNGFKCFEPIFNEGQPSYIGAPLLILVDENDNIRLSTNEEAMQQIHDTEKQTKEEAINEYTKKFGGFPYFLFMGASDEVIVKAIQEALKTGNAITAEENKNDY